MQTPKTRRHFTAQFKRDAVELSFQSDKTAVEIARDLGIRPELLYRWRSEFRRQPAEAFPGSGHLADPAAEQVRQLQRQLVAIETERDILKKALAIFSQRPE